MSEQNTDNTPADKTEPDNTPADKTKPDNTPADKTKPDNIPADKTKPDNSIAPDKALADLANEFVTELPEELQKVVPASLTDSEKIKFCRDLVSGVKTLTANHADSPGAERPNRNGGPDLNSMTTNELLGLGLK